MKNELMVLQAMVKMLIPMLITTLTLATLYVTIIPMKIKQNNYRRLKKIWITKI